MKVLVTGNMGYIGSVLVPILIGRGYEVNGFDIGYYNDDCRLYEYERIPFAQIIKDIRDVTVNDVEGFDAVIHLAALSNDALGELDPSFTEEINLNSTLKLAKAAKKSGVKRFIYSSSQSMYGVSDFEGELDEEAPKNPVTAYARTKWDAELGLKEMSSKDFAVVCFRPSTVFGASPKLRCDIVYNNFVGCAFTTNKIEIKSDGTPWRPVVHIQDACSAYIAGLEAPLSLVEGKSYNVGIKDGNYTVRDLAEAAQRVVSGSALTFTGEHGADPRTYKVSFKKILTELNDYFRPQWDLDRGGRELVALFRKVGFTEDMFRGRMTNRLKQIDYMIASHVIDHDLRRVNEKGLDR